MIFENSSLKGISGQNMTDSSKWSLTDDSRSLQADLLKNPNWQEAHQMAISGKRQGAVLVAGADLTQRFADINFQSPEKCSPAPLSGFSRMLECCVSGMHILFIAIPGSTVWGKGTRNIG